MLIVRGIISVKWVRPIISLVGMAGVTVGFFMGMVATEAYLGIVTLAITWWFKSRDTEKGKGNGTDGGSN
uniref:Uncharacterized protein n=1 Tax=viral metagenome TaxID=1070528 RepID=A0A6M3KF10_9ZZZZ